MSDKYKIVESLSQNTVIDGPPGSTKSGISEEEAQKEADYRNKKAEDLGIKTRYEVAPL